MVLLRTQHLVVVTPNILVILQFTNIVALVSDESMSVCLVPSLLSILCEWYPAFAPPPRQVILVLAFPCGELHSNPAFDQNQCAF